jgi:predicted histidine transporter YuiF (NhaC family)
MTVNLSFSLLLKKSFLTRMRALVPVAIGAAAGGGLSLHYWLWVVTRDLAGEALVTLSRAALISLAPTVNFGPWLQVLWQLGGAFICWELREEIFQCLKLLFAVAVFFIGVLSSSLCCFT